MIVVFSMYTGWAPTLTSRQRPTDILTNTSYFETSRKDLAVPEVTLQGKDPFMTLHYQRSVIHNASRV